MTADITSAQPSRKRSRRDEIISWFLTLAFIIVCLYVVFTVPVPHQHVVGGYFYYNTTYRYNGAEYAANYVMNVSTGLCSFELYNASNAHLAQYSAFGTSTYDTKNILEHEIVNQTAPYTSCLR